MCGSMADIQSATADIRRGKKKKEELAATLRGSRPGMQSTSLYDNFCKTRNYVIYDAIIWVQDGNCKKWLERILVLVRSTI